MAELIQLVPFDETSGTTAQDFSGNDYNIEITDGTWVQGKINNAVHLTENSLAEIIGTSVVDFSEDFTYTFWFKSDILGTLPTSTWFLYKFNGEENYLYLNANTKGTNWTYVCIIQEANKVSLFINGNLTASEEFPELWGTPTGFCLLNDIETENSSDITLDNLEVYSGVNLNSIKPRQFPMTIQYKINYVDFKDYSVSVRKGDGFFDALKMKEPFKVDWADEHGEVLDLTEVRYEPRTITLDCFIHGTTKDVFDEKVKGFLDKFYGSGTKRLHINTGSIDYVYEVYLRDGSNVKKKWRDADMIGEFTLTLVEPQPIKRIIHFIRADGNTTASITLTCPRPLTIYWGDGSVTDNVMGTSVTTTHTYSVNGSKFIILAGVIEKVSSLTTNGTLMNGANSYY